MAEGYPTQIFKGSPKSLPYICMQCTLILRVPTQAGCGHLFCKDCAIEILSCNHPPRCPECQAEGVEYVLNADELNYDKASHKNLCKEMVFCSKSGCPWSGLFREFEDHYQICGQRQNPEAEQTLIQEANLNQNNSDCERQSTDGTTYQSMQPMMDNLAVLLGQYIFLLFRVFLSSFEILVRNHEIGQQNGRIVRCAQNIQLQADRLNDLSDRAERLEQEDGSLIWKVSGISNLIINIKTFTKIFYTKPQGSMKYSLEANLYPNGIADGAGTHISLAVRIIKGDFDVLMKWPVEMKITISLLDHRNTLLRMESFIAKFSQPRSDARECPHGFPKFFSHSELLNAIAAGSVGDISEQDTVYIKVEAEVLL